MSETLFAAKLLADAKEICFPYAIRLIVNDYCCLWCSFTCTRTCNNNNNNNNNIIIAIFREEATSALAGFHAGPLSRSNWNLEMLVFHYIVWLYY